MYSYELFIADNIVNKTLWEALLERLKNYDKNVTLEILFNANTVEFFLHSQKNLSALSRVLDNIILNPSRIFTTIRH